MVLSSSKASRTWKRTTPAFRQCFVIRLVVTTTLVLSLDPSWTERLTFSTGLKVPSTTTASATKKSNCFQNSTAGSTLLCPSTFPSSPFRARNLEVSYRITETWSPTEGRSMMPLQKYHAKKTTAIVDTNEEQEPFFASMTKTKWPSSMRCERILHISIFLYRLELCSKKSNRYSRKRRGTMLHRSC